MSPNSAGYLSKARRDSGSGKKMSLDVSKLVALEQVQGQIMALARDQIGCRFLQRKLEEQGQAGVDVILAETFDHIVDLMTGMFP